MRRRHASGFSAAVSGQLHDKKVLALDPRRFPNSQIESPMKNETVLAIESAVGGGSLALIVDGNAVEKWHGNGKVSRSEELLGQISNIVEKAGLELKQISSIAVSNGPGSYTGIRIGMATALGLARALSIPCVGVFLLSALELWSKSWGERIIVVPIGRTGYSWRYKKPGTETEGEAGFEALHSGNIQELNRFVIARPNAIILAQTDAFDDLAAAEEIADTIEVVDIGRDLAEAVGLASSTIDSGMKPHYARDTSPRAV